MDYDVLMENGYWVIPLVIAIVQAFKMTGIPTKYAPLISVGIGIGLAFVANPEFTANQSVLSGVIYGLSASGLYSGVRTTQMVRDVKSGVVPVEKVDVDLLSDKDKKEIIESQGKYAEEILNSNSK